MLHPHHTECSKEDRPPYPALCAGYVLKCLLSPDMRQLATIMA